ncbi:uncharacterized protein LOC131402210 isoform X2 [Diceros bicornis minor]|uniref:uncharacterized protein LOC131402210 isoform X2 n=1 Tax=Diceros bicornis minor TaxID=77932 RepID=UPI0026F08D72|nr:uncharacterized protein LOC131402210 isoform X2 [Diceros bicornis minor]
MVLAGLFQEELPSWRHQQVSGFHEARTLLLLLSSPHLQGAAPCLPQGCAWQRIPMAQVEKQAAHPQEGPSTFAPRRATPRECRRSSSSSRVLSPILALSSVTCRCCTWRWEYRVMREILLLQVAAKNYNKTPRSDLGPGSRTWSCSTRMSQTPRVEVFKRSSLIYLRVWQAYLWMFKPDIPRRTTSLHP